MSRPRSRRSGNNDDGPRDDRASEDAVAPVVLPHVVVQVGEDGTLTVTVEGEPFEPEEFAPAWQRSTFGALIDAVTDQRRVPVRVEVREVDGTTFTDIITPGRRRRRGTENDDMATPEPAQPGLVEVTGEGFVPGEDVAVAVIVSHTDASPTGEARALLEATHLDRAASRDVILLGRVSGVVTVRRAR